MTRGDGSEPWVDAEPALAWRTDGADTGAADHFAPAGDEPALAWTGRDDLPTFRAYYAQRRAATTPAQQRTALLLAALIGGPAAVLTAFANFGGVGSWVGVLLIVVFAVIENLLYLNIYITDPTPGIIRWRWIAGPLLHGGAATLSGIGVARTWRAVDAGEGLPDVRRASRWITAAIVVHATYNLAAVVLELTGALPV